MTEGTQVSFDFPPVKRRRTDARFSGGDITSDGGLLLLRQADRRLGLLESVNARLPDPRHGRYVRHDQLALLRQRVYALCQGYEDLNDHDQLRGDLPLQTATEQNQVLGSSPTLCRLENRMGREAVVAIHQVLVEQFIASFAEPPEELILDFDATDDRVHGLQEGRFFHGYYDAYAPVRLL